MITNNILTDYVRNRYKRRKISNILEIFGARRLSEYAKYIVARNKKLGNSIYGNIDYYSDILHNPLTRCSKCCITSMHIDRDMNLSYNCSFNANYYYNNIKAGTSLSKIIKKEYKVWYDIK